jgi:tRNA(fMet)-specific endonuclease VapC
MGVIVDSCVFIAAERRRFDLEAFGKENDPASFMSTVTWSELLKGLHRASAEPIREGRRSFIYGLLPDFPLINFGREEAEIHAKITAALDVSGQRIGAYDSMIAATAVAHDWSIATLNLSEFQRVPGLKVIDAAPWLVK